VRGSADPQARAAASALQHRQIAGGRVLVVSANEKEVAAIDEVLSEDGLVLLRLPDMRAAVIRSAELAPDLAIVDRELLDGDGEPALEPLRTALARGNFPVVVLADTSVGARGVHRGVGPSTDYLAKPFSPPMLRARVRAWLARTLLAAEVRPAPVGAPGGADAVPERVGHRSRLAAMLATVPLFRSLSNEQRDLLIMQASDQVFVPGQIVIRQGESADSIFVILAGRVRVLEASPDANADVLLGELGEGEILGELGVLRSQARSATVVAVERTHCLVLRHGDFLHVLQTSAELAVSLLRTVAGRLYEADRRLSRYAPDPITGLAGRRAFHDQYRRLAAVARRRNNGGLLVVLDVHQLKNINDQHGYAVGDDVLRTVGDALIEATRTTDLVARHGGDEFAVFLPDVGPKDVDVVLARVRDKLAELSQKRGLPLTPRCNVGVAYSQAPPDTADDLLREADLDMARRRRPA